MAAPGFTTWHETVTVTHEGVESNVVVRLVPIGAPPAPAEVHVATPPATSSRRLYGEIGVISGSAIIVGGLVAGGLAYSQWQHAQTCTDCDRQVESHTAIVRGDFSTGLVIVGAVVAAAGGYLWRTSSNSAEVTAAVTHDSAGLALVGRF